MLCKHVCACSALTLHSPWPQAHRPVRRYQASSAFALWQTVGHRKHSDELTRAACGAQPHDARCEGAVGGRQELAAEGAEAAAAARARGARAQRL